MRSRLALAALLLSTPLVHTGCASRSSGLPNAPIFNTGVSATIIPPGAAAPAMPGYGQQRSSSSGPGQSSGSYSGGYSGIPGMGGPPPGYGGQGVPGQPQGYPTAQPAPQTQMLGGAVTIDTRQIRRKEDPLWSNPLFWPFAVVAYPFVKLDRAVSAKKDEEFRRRAYTRIQEQTGVPFPDDSPYATRQQSQMAHEHAQQQAMEQQLLQQQRGGGVGVDGGSAAYASVSPRPSLSIADELEALRGGRAPGAAPAAEPARAPASSGAAPSPGAAAADEAEDRDGDGRADRWVYESDGRKRELLDEDRDGRPERTTWYEPDGKTIARVDEDTDGDGEVDSWSTWQGGSLARRRADTDHDGEPDTWTTYDAKGKMARHEQDANGDGVRDTVDYYTAGRIARRTEDADGDGRPERITHFDEKGRPSILEEDTDGDGLVDTRSHYSGGKLVRRELLDEARATR
jgi:hypothetical protein